MKPSERIQEIYIQVYKESTGAEQMQINDDALSELAARYEALLRYLDEDYKKTH